MARICLVGSVAQDPGLRQVAETFKVPVVASDTGQEFVDDESYYTYFVIEDFEGASFDFLNEKTCRILGIQAFQKLSENSEALPPPKRMRPTYSYAMKSVIIGFTGFKEKDDLNHLVKICHYLGGSTRKRPNRHITHLIADSINGNNYWYGPTFNVPVMARSWIITAWERRHDIEYSCQNPDTLAKHKLRFGGVRICFIGFSDDETKRMSEILVSNNGILSSSDDPQCRYIVVNEAVDISLPDMIPTRAYIVKSGWFWASVQNELCEIKDEYIYRDGLRDMLSPIRSRDLGAATRSRKRKWSQQMASPDVGESPISLKRRSVSNPAFLSLSSSYLDYTATPEKDLSFEIKKNKFKSVTARYLVFEELVATEENYVGVLRTIIELFKEPFEAMLLKDSAILNVTEVNIIFGKLPPIYELHLSILESLKWGVENYTEDFSIGNVILKYAPEFERAYCPFINYFENITQTLEECYMSKPNFHEFLEKMKENEPDCNRQSLKELLICPVQRLPRISLLLNELLKKTDRQNPDYTALDEALACIKQAMTNINNDKKKTEDQLAMLNLPNEIENCPPDLVSSHRRLIDKCECVELTEVLSSKKTPVMLLLFTDTLEICRKQNKQFNTFKNSKPNNLQKVHRNQYKHIKRIDLSDLRKVINIKESDECSKNFAILYRTEQSLGENLFLFKITDVSVDKFAFLNKMCKQIAYSISNGDEEDDFFDEMDPNEINLDTSCNVSIRSTHSFSKALRVGVKGGLRRALSMSKTPKKFKRELSTARSFVAQGTLTRNASKLAQLRLQSCANLNELTFTPPRSASSPKTPKSAPPPRRNMLTSVFSVSSLKL